MPQADANQREDPAWTCWVRPFGVRARSSHVIELQRDPTSGQPRLRARTNSPGWFDDFFTEHALRAVKLARLLGADDAEDVAQEAFVKLLLKSPGLGEDAHVVGYLNRIIVNEVRDRHSRRIVALRKRHLLVVRDDASFDTEACVDAAEMWSALSRLSASQREVVVLHYWSQLSLREIADLLGRPTSTIKSHHRRALRRLENLIEEMNET